VRKLYREPELQSKIIEHNRHDVVVQKVVVVLVAFFDESLMNAVGLYDSWLDVEYALECVSYPYGLVTIFDDVRW